VSGLYISLRDHTECRPLERIDTAAGFAPVDRNIVRCPGCGTNYERRQDRLPIVCSVCNGEVSCLT
jgi:hypothetical protein